MIFYLAVILISGLFIYKDLVPIFKKKQWLIFWVYITFTVTVYVSALLIALGKKIPSPADPLKKFITTIWGIG